MKHLGPVIVRISLITAIVITGYLIYQSPSFSNQLKSLLSSLGNKASSLNIGDGNLALTFKQKLIDQQPIINENSQETVSPSTVMGTSTSMVTQQAKDFVTTTTQKVMSDLQSLPKEQAADLVRQACDQIISELER